MTVFTAEKLKKELKLHQMFTMAFGATIGVSWITMLGAWIAQGGAIGAIIAFLVGGGVMLLIGLCYAEISSIFPASGGEIVYAYKAFGAAAAFAAGWLLLLLFVAVMAFLAVSAGWIVAVLSPPLAGPVLYKAFGASVTLGDMVLSLGGIAGLAWLNYRGGKAAARFQDIATYALIIAAVLFIGVGLYEGKLAYLAPAFADHSGSGALHGIVVVLMVSPLWFSGFSVVPQAIGELAPGVPVRRVAVAMLLGIVAVTVFYVLLILATSMIMPRTALLRLELPAAGAFEAAFRHRAMSQLVLCAGLLGLVTSWNAVFFSGARALFALSRTRLLPPYFAAVHPQFGSPYRAIAAIAVVSAAASFLGVGAIGRLANTGGMCFSLLFLLVSMAVLHLRYRQPGLQRPFRVHGGASVACLAALASFGMLSISVWETRPRTFFPVEWCLLFGWAAMGVVIWKITRCVRHEISETDRARFILGE